MEEGAPLSLPDFRGLGATSMPRLDTRRRNLLSLIGVPSTAAWRSKAMYPDVTRLFADIASYTRCSEVEAHTDFQWFNPHATLYLRGL